MRAQRESSLEQVLLFAAGETIYVLDDGIIEPVVQRPRQVKSLITYKGRVLDCGNYNGVLDTETGKPVSPYLGSRSWNQVAGIGDDIYGLSKEGQVLDLTSRFSRIHLPIETVELIGGRKKLTFYGRTDVTDNKFLEKKTLLGIYDPREDSIKEISGESVQKLNHSHNPITAFDVNLEDNLYSAHSFGEVLYLDELGSLINPRIGLVKSPQLLNCKKAIRIYNSHFFEQRSFRSSFDYDKKVGWEKFMNLYEFIQKKKVFDDSVWNVHDYSGHLEFMRTFNRNKLKRTSKIRVEKMSFEDAISYYNNKFGDFCSNYLSYHNNTHGHWDSVHLDFVIEQVIRNMLEETRKKNKISSISQVNNSVIVGTRAGRLLELDNSFDEVRYGNNTGRIYTTEHQFYGYNAYGEHHGSAEAGSLINFNYPKGWAKGNEIKFQERRKDKRPITAMLAITREEFENSGIKQRVNNLRRNRFYFANSGNWQEVIVPFRKAA